MRERERERERGGGEKRQVVKEDMHIPHAHSDTKQFTETGFSL